MGGDVIHIVHWRNSGIYSVASELSIEGQRCGQRHLIRVIRKDKTYYDLTVSFLRMVLIIFEMLFKRKNLYHAHSFLPFLLLYFSPKMKALTFHNLYPYFFSTSNKNYIKRFLIIQLVKLKKIKTSSVGVGVASAVKESMDISSEVIFNGLRPERYEFVIPKNRKILGTAGRLDDQKNYESLVVAFSKCDSKDLVLKIAGEGVKKGALERLIDQYGMVGRIQLLGHQSEMPSFYSSIDAFICSSFYEGCNLVVAESMFSGKPVISTNVGIALDFDSVSLIRSGFDIDELSKSINAWTKLSNSDIENYVSHNRAIVSDAFLISNIYQKYVDTLWTGFEFKKFL